MKTEQEAARAHGRMQRKNFLIVINPRSGSYRGKALQKRISVAISSQESPGNTYCIDEWENLSHRISQAVSAGIRSFFIVMGGDGTIAAVASCLRGTQCTISIIPSGTSNMLAQAIGIPTNFRDIFNMLNSSGETRTIDGLEINGRLYFMNASAGISSASLEYLKQEQKSSLGLIAYVFAVIRRIFQTSPKTFLLKIDGKSQQVRAAEVFIANIGSLLAPRYKLADTAR
ncbi:MAG: hypothetical protein J7K94_01995 [Dehalococcoidia bacterium]|nr:hypothetical protein [Dehalococcoidia bacterium]